MRARPPRRRLLVAASRRSASERARAGPPSVSGALAAALSLPSRSSRPYGVGLTAGPFFASLSAGARTRAARGRRRRTARVRSRRASRSAAGGGRRGRRAASAARRAGGAAARRARGRARGAARRASACGSDGELGARGRALHVCALGLVGIAVTVLLGWHVYLVLSAQTTIEFYGNQTRKLRARVRGQRYHPVRHGARANCEFVFAAAEARRRAGALRAERARRGRRGPESRDARARQRTREAAATGGCARVRARGSDRALPALLTRRRSRGPVHAHPSMLPSVRACTASAIIGLGGGAGDARGAARRERRRQARAARRRRRSPSVRFGSTTGEARALSADSATRGGASSLILGARAAASARARVERAEGGGRRARLCRSSAVPLY